MSYDSTVPSSVDSDDLPAPNTTLPRQNSEPPDALMPKSLNPFSTFDNAKESAARHQDDTPSYNQKTNDNASSHRNRAGTESSEASTATPFVASDLGWDYGSSAFGNVLGNINSNNQSRPTPGKVSSPMRATSPPYIPKAARPATTPKASDADSLKENEAPRRNSFGPGDDSQIVLDAVYASHALEQEHSPALSTAPLVDRTARRSPYDTSGESPSNSGFMGTMASSIASSKMRKVPRQPSPSPNGLFGIQDMQRSSTPGGKSREEPFFRQQIDSMRPKSRSPGPMGAQNKVMTTKEFEQYMREKAAAAALDDAKSDASSESDNYEDEDETERLKQNMRQRRKQEAHLSVYRQQMMKVTGEQASDLPANHPRSILERTSKSSPNFLASLSFDSKPEGKEQKDKSSDDEDEDVPLGVLQAHGFPHKSRPPTRMTNSGTLRPQSQMSAYPSPSAATRNEAASGGGGNLPAFAKNLPVDPYVGAGVVQNRSRESLPYGAQSPPVPGVPPGGLVGVIAGEERARAMRRGTPNAQGSYGPVRQMSSPSMQMGPMSPAEQAQAQMSQQMQQMMQMQMQWMQQLQQMMQMMPPGTQMPQMPQMPPMPGMPNMAQSTPNLLGNNGFLQPPEPMRPLSMASQQSSGSSLHPAQRAQSSMSHKPQGGTRPSSSAQSVYGLQQHYAPSIAPSERSNIGQPTRYRPVSTLAGIDGSKSSSKAQSRTSTMTATTTQGLGRIEESRSRSRLRATDQPSKPTIKAVNKPKRGVGSTSDDEDEEGWAEMKKKREQRKSRWRGGGARGRSATRLNSASGDAPPLEGLEGLYYEG